MVCDNLRGSSELRYAPIFSMKTTTATYMINVTTDDENVISFYKTMPTRPTTSKGIKSQNNKLSQWVEKEYPNFTEYEITAI